MNILITGATGTVGRSLTQHLNHASSEHRLFFAVRWPAMARQEIQCKTWQLRQFDFEDVYSYLPALKDIDKLFLLRPRHLSNVNGYIKPLIEAAKQNNLKQIVFLSIQSADKNKWTPQYAIEKEIRKSGIKYVFLRPGNFMQNFLGEINEGITSKDEISVPAGSRRFSFIDVEELTEVAAKVLLNPPPVSAQYTLTGTSPIDYYRVATIISESIGRPIKYTNPSPLWFITKQLIDGQPIKKAVEKLAFYRFNRVPSADQYRHTLQQLLHRPPKTLRNFFIESQDQFAPEPSTVPAANKTTD
ncbi:MAG: NmrA family NAD(P)-binding protein [Phaeodactylibacter sp.]|nr:NmrA family NAD(P)-binding protein [Phaeodactylibacter sp.]